MPEPRRSPTAELLTHGVERSARDGTIVTYGWLGAGADLDTITALLHRAYAVHARAGLRFAASHQTPAVTARRLSKGDTIAAHADGQLVGVVTLARPEATSGSPFYDRPDVTSFGQFAVEPALHGAGIGSMLLHFVEALAAERGLAHLALDTSERATGLIAFYERRGYRFVEHVQWAEVNYRSVILARALTEPASPVEE